MQSGSPGPHGQQAPGSDRGAVRDQARQPATDAVGQLQLALGGELEHDYRGVQLGQAGPLVRVLALARVPAVANVTGNSKRSRQACPLSREPSRVRA